jgi:hypothetical protein
MKRLREEDERRKQNGLRPKARNGFTNLDGI